MKNIFTCGIAAIALSMVCSAAPINCTGGLISLTPGGASPTISCGGLTFSDFSITNLSGENAGHLDINAASFDDVTGIVVLNENPNLGSGGHMDLFFTITGPLDGIDLSVGGTFATVTERACANPIPMGGTLANLCTNPEQTTNVAPLAQLTVHSLDLGQPFFAAFPATSPVYIFKDIGVSGPGGLSTLNESFHVAGTPEPATMTLAGIALLGLGFAKRRKAVQARS